MGTKTSKLRHWRQERGLTLQEVADLTGWTPSMISRWERGERALSPETKVIFARRVGARIADLFEIEEVDA